MAQISQFPPVGPQRSSGATSGSLALQPDEAGAVSLSLPALLDQWRNNAEIQEYLKLVANQDPKISQAFFVVGDQTISREKILDFATRFYSDFRQALAGDTSLRAFLQTPSPKAVELQVLLAKQFPSQTREVVLWLDRMVGTTEGILPELSVAPALQVEEPVPAELDSDEPLELDSAKVVTQPQDNQTASQAAAPDNISTDFITAEPTPAYQQIAIFNGYAKNKIGFMLLHQYGITAESGNPWDYLSPQLQYQIENKLRTFTFSLDDEQFKNLNRQQFTQAFFDQFRQDNFALLRPEAALRPAVVEKATSQPAIPLATDTETAVDAEVIAEVPTPEDPQLEHAFQDVKHLTQGQFFSQNMKQVEDRLYKNLGAKGLSSIEVQGLREFADMVPAVGEDLNALMKGASKTQLVSMFPFLAKYDDSAILTIVNDLRNYSAHQQGLLIQITGVSPKDIPLPSEEVAEALSNPDTGLGQVTVANHSERLLNVTTVAQEVGLQNGLVMQMAEATSAAQIANPQDPVYKRIYQRVVYPLQYSNNASQDVNQHNAEKFISGVQRFQEAVYLELMRELEGRAPQAAARLKALNDYYARQDELLEQQTTETLKQWRDAMLQTEFGQQVSNYYLTNVAHTPLGKFVNDVYTARFGEGENGAVVPGNSRGTNVLELYQKYRQQRKVAQAASAANKAQAAKDAVDKTKFLSRILIQAKKAADTVKNALGLTRVVIFVQGIVSSILGALAPLMPILVPAAGLLAGLVTVFPQLGASLLSAAQSIFSPFANSTLQQWGAPSANAAGTQGGAAAQTGQQSALGKATQAAKEFLNPSTTFGTTTLSIGGAAAFTGTVLMTSNTLQGAFYKPLNLRGEFSPYVDIVKTATVNGSTVTKLDQLAQSTTVTYTITISPQPGYQLSITKMEDTRSVIFNTGKLAAENRTAPEVTNTTRTYETAEGGTKHPEFADDLTAWGNAPQLAEGNVLTLTYTELLTPQFMDSNVNNSFSLTFDVTPTTGKEPGAKGEVATMNHSLCVGECPELSGGCWPVDGQISQFPFDDDEPDGQHNHGYSHSPGGMAITPKGQDAFDISQNGGQEVVAPFAGRLCSRPYDANGYGTYVVLDQIAGTEQYGANFQLHFAHLSRSTFGSVAGIQCKQVNVGDLIGVVGNSGNSGGYHLHYAASPVITSYESRIRDLVTVTSNAAIGTRVSTQGPICQKTGS